MSKVCKCLECGKEFESFKNIKKYCSKKCREKYWVNHNRDYLNEKVRAYRKRRYQEDGFWRDGSKIARENKAWMIEIKSKPCHDCGGTFEVCCMDFDHREGEVKEYNVGTMFAHHYSRELIEKEISKCDLVCANCHRIRTKLRRTGNGKYKKTN